MCRLNRPLELQKLKSPNPNARFDLDAQIGFLAVAAAENEMKKLQAEVKNLRKQLAKANTELREFRKAQRDLLAVVRFQNKIIKVLVMLLFIVAICFVVANN
uniref:Uncharacterized protein n=1 Tax=Globodera rostochiensis TaxID=31243 RepID=A0A914HQR8_GLORO